MDALIVRENITPPRNEYNVPSAAYRSLYDIAGLGRPDGFCQDPGNGLTLGDGSEAVCPERLGRNHDRMIALIHVQT
jgi:hypothetical protein